MKINYTIDPRTPPELIEPLMRANEMIDRVASYVAPRVTAEWEYLPGASGKAAFRLVLSDSAGGSMDKVFALEELQSAESAWRAIHWFWGDLLWDTAARQRERNSRLLEEFLAETE